MHGRARRRDGDAFLEPQHGRDAIDVMRGLKQPLEGHDLMNPGKVLPYRFGRA